MNSKTLIILIIVFSMLLNFVAYSYFYLTENGYPLLSFMTSSSGRFDDFYNNLFYPGEFLRSKADFPMYPLSIFLYKFFSISNIHLAAIIFFFTMSSLLFWSLGKLGPGILFMILLLVSYPFHFTIARGNNEILIVAIAAIMYRNIVLKRYNKAFVNLVILFLFEPYPFYLFTLFLYPKKYIVKFARWIFVSVIFLFILLLEPSVRLYVITILFDGAGYLTGAGPGSTLHSSSLSGLIQYLFLIRYNSFPYELILFQVISRMVPIIGTLVVLIIFIKYRNKIDTLTSSLLIIGSWTLISSTSFDYRLLHFFIPLAFLLKEQKTKLDYAVVFLIMILFVPKPYILFKAPNNSLGETLGSVINPIIIMGIMSVTLMKFLRFRSEHKYKKLNKFKTGFNKKKNRDLN